MNLSRGVRMHSSISDTLLAVSDAWVTSSDACVAVSDGQVAVSDTDVAVSDNTREFPTPGWQFPTIGVSDGRAAARGPRDSRDWLGFPTGGVRDYLLGGAL